ncbi:uncharacterized protein LOC117176193 isoform X2 [Belonocnema kinseyi]|nr:uncharacterized protein LOC117176193 isoform X2 [Belonocnema kinseyi]
MARRSLNVLLTEEAISEKNEKAINLIDENLFKLQCIIKASDIRLCARHESSGKELLAFTIGTLDLGLYYLADTSQPPVIKNVPWFQGSCKAITALCFDPSGYGLLIACVDGSLHIIPAGGLVDTKRKTPQKWKNVDDIVSFPSLNSQSFCSRPSSLIWWQCMAVSSQVAIVGTEQGEILFIDLDTGQQVGFTRIDGHVSSFQICQDSELDTVNLIITSQLKKQWHLVLEQPAKGYVFMHNNGTASSESYSQGSSGHSENNEKTFASTIKRWQSRSRLKGLKQLSFDNFSILRKKPSKNKTSSFDESHVSGSIDSSNYSLCIGSDNLMNPAPTNSPAFLVVQYADHGRRLYTRYFSPKNILTVHENSTSLLPLCVHKLPDYSKDVLLTHHLFYVIDVHRQTLSIISRALSQDKQNGNSQFNRESVVARFSFGKRNEVINGLFIANASKELIENAFHNNEDTYTIPKFIKDLKIKLVHQSPCIIVTNCGIYRVTLRSSLLSLFMDLIISRTELDKAKRLAKIFGLNVRQLLEYAGDILLANDRFYQAATLYKEARCRPSKIFAKLASVGCTSELLNCLVHCLEHPAPLKLSIVEKMSLSNLSIIAFTELSVRATTQKEQQIYKEFMNFLSTNMFYDEQVAVNIIGQAHLWNILHHLVIKRGLFTQALDILMKTLPLFFSFKNSHLHANHDLLMTISEPNLIRGMIANPSIAKSHMSFVLANLSSLQTFVLQRLITLYDPTNPLLRPLVRQCKGRNRTNSRNSLSSSIESTEMQEEIATLMEKIVEMFLLILLVFIQKSTPTLGHKSELMKYVSLSGMKKEPAFNIQYKRRFISAGFSHVALLRNKVIYTWGSTIIGSLGSGSVSSVCDTPQEINIFRRMNIEVISVSSGHCHTLALTNNGVYAWGGSKFGQVGLGILTQCSSPQLITSLADEIVIDCAAGQYHSVALTSDGRVFTWGWGVHGQLGHGNTENVNLPTLVTSLLGTAINHISAGHAHTMVLSADGVVYVFGCNNVGQLGMTNSRKCLIPQKVPLLPEKISLIATKYFHNLAVTSTNKLYIWGISPRELQLQKLKVPDSESGDENEKPNLSSCSSAEDCVESENISTIIEQDDSLNNRINSTNNHTFEESVDNEDFQKHNDIQKSSSNLSSCPSTLNGKMSRTYWKPSVVDTSLLKGQVKQLSTGWNHSALLTKDGTVYIWGRNSCGQLGNNDRGEIVRPTPLIYNPVLSLSHLPSKNVRSRSFEKENGLNMNSKTRNYRLNNVEERDKIDDCDNDNKGVESGENEDDDDNNNNDEDDDSVTDADDEESNDNYNYDNDLNEKDIDDFENCVNSNNLEMKAIQVSCGSNYTVAVQPGGAVLAWGRIGISQSKSPGFLRMRKRTDKRNCDTEDNSITLKCLLNTIGLQKNRVVACISNPSQVPNIPAPVISYQSYDTVPLVGFKRMHPAEKIPGERTLHDALEQFSGFYDVNKILKKCIAVGNNQACAKLALLEHNFSDSLMYQLKSVMNIESGQELNDKNEKEEINCTDVTIEKSSNGYLKKSRKADKKKDNIKIFNADEKKSVLGYLEQDVIEEKPQINKSSTFDHLNDDSQLFIEQAEEDLVNTFEESVTKRKLKMSASKSMDTFSLTEHELYTFDCQGGSEEMYEQTDNDNVSDQLTMTNSTFDDEFNSDSESESRKNDGLQTSPCVDKIKKAMNIVEFYINEIENLNHKVVSEVLLNAINIWVDHHLPLRFLEKVFLKNLHKVFYPLGLLLFCQNSACKDTIKEDDQIRVTRGIDLLSTKLTLKVCSMLLEHIQQGQSTPEYVEALSQSVAKSYGPPLTGYPGSNENQTIEQMLEGMKSTLSSKQSDPRPFIHIKDPESVSRFLEMGKDTTVFTCGHYFPVSSYQTELVPQMETELLVSQPLPLPCTAQVLGKVLHQAEELDTMCPLCMPRALQTVVSNLISE